MTISHDLIRRLAAKAPTTSSSPTAATLANAGPKRRLDLPRILQDSGINVHKEKREPDGRVIYEVDCMTSDAHDAGAFFTQFPDGGVAYNCHHDSCSGKRWDDVRHRLTLPPEPTLTYGGMDPREWREKVSAQTPKGNGMGTNESLFRTPSEMVASGSDEPEWIVRGHLALGGLTDLVGKIKTGKTSFVLAMVKAMLDGRKFIGQSCRQTPVVLLTEQADSSLVQALKRAGLLEHHDLHILSWHMARSLSWPQAVAMAADHAANVDAGVLIVDTLGRWASIAGDSENDAGAAATAVEPLKLAAATLNLAVMTVRHGRKSGGDIGDDGRGSSAFGGEADILLSLRRPEGNHSDRPGVRELQGIGRYDETPERVLIELQGDEYVLLGDEAAVAHAEARNAVLDTLPASQSDAMSEADITKATGAKRTTVQRVLKEQVDAGVVGRVGAGKRNDPVRYWKREMVSAQSSVIGRAETNAMPPDPTPLRPEPLEPTGTDGAWEGMDL